jgi:hypothetical protein
MSAVIAEVLPALAKRYSSCAWTGFPRPASALTSDGSTQASAVPVTESATPTTVSFCDPAVTVDPGNTPVPRSITIWLPPSGQWPSSSVRSSTRPPGEGRPTTRSESGDEPGTPGTVTCAVTKTPGYGPAAAVTPASRVVAAICGWVATDGFTAAVTSAPFWRANARSNGPFALASKPRATTEVAVAASSTTPMITACSLRRPIPPRAARMTAVTAAPRCRRRCARRRSQSPGGSTGRPGPGCE